MDTIKNATLAKLQKLVNRWTATADDFMEYVMGPLPLCVRRNICAEAKANGLTPRAYMRREYAAVIYRDMIAGGKVALEMEVAA